MRFLTSLVKKNCAPSYNPCQADTATTLVIRLLQYSVTPHVPERDITMGFDNGPASRYIASLSIHNGIHDRAYSSIVHFVALDHGILIVYLHDERPRYKKPTVKIQI